MGAPDQKPTEQQKAKARQAVTDRLRRFYGTLLSGLDADADEFFRRVMEQKKIRDHDHVGSRP
jgi:hypothetical protein